MDTVDRIARDPRVRAATSALESQREELVRLVCTVQQIAAPTFAEQARAAFVERRFREIGLHDVQQDALHNVYARLPGRASRQRPPLVVSAHSDTVFAAGTDLSIVRDGSYLRGAGIGDNATGVAGLIWLAQTLCASRLDIDADIWLVSNVREEGLGDLQGMRAVVERFGEALYIVIEGGLYGQISHQAIAVRRLRIELKGPGGHSWGSFGQPSAIHELARLIAAIGAIKLPEAPKTTYNVGVIEGGTTVNTIAASASMLLDLRSENSYELERLMGRVTRLIGQHRREALASGQDLTFHVEKIGDRPAGSIDRKEPLVRWATSALRHAGCADLNYVASSTDANIPLSRGLPAVCVGLTLAGHSHRLDEYIDPAYLSSGMHQLLLLTLAAAGYRTQSENS